MGVANPLDIISLNDLQMQFIAVVKVQPQLATIHAKLITHFFGFVNHALGAHRPRGSPNTPNSILRALKLWYILPALLHSLDRRRSRTVKFNSAERGDLTTILPWLMQYTEGTVTRFRDQHAKQRTRPSSRRPRQCAGTNGG